MAVQLLIIRVFSLVPLIFSKTDEDGKNQLPNGAMSLVVSPIIFSEGNKWEKLEDFLISKYRAKPRRYFGVEDLKVRIEVFC